MALQSIGLGVAPSGAGGDSARTAFEKMNANFSNPAHAASKLAQASPTDTTAGALMAVGAFGLGARNGASTSNVGALESGMYILQRRLNGGNTPAVFTDGDYGVVFKNGYASGPAGVLSSALAYATTTQKLWWLSSLGTSIEDVTLEILTRKSILGTASQSGGVPTGAIIERGSNANGEYVRFADGTQICWGSGGTLLTPNAAAGGYQGSTLTNVTYPAAFSNVPRVAPNGRYPGTGNRAWVTVQTLGSSYFSCIAHSFHADGNCIADYVAIGRWFN